MACLKTLNFTRNETFDASTIADSVLTDAFNEESFLLLDDNYWKTVKPIEHLPIRMQNPTRRININRFGGWRLDDYKNCSVATCSSETELSNEIVTQLAEPVLPSVRWTKQNDREMFSVLTQL